jgi:hypothetical protein
LSGFLSGFPSLDAFLIIVSVGIRCIYIYIKCNKKKDNATFKVNREIIKTTPSPHLLSAIAVEISSPRNHGGWLKSNGGGECEHQVVKVSTFLSQLRP